MGIAKGPGPNGPQLPKTGRKIPPPARSLDDTKLTAVFLSDQAALQSAALRQCSPYHFPLMRIVSTAFWLTLLLACASYHANAQTDFRPGYVLPLIGDTLKGEVDQRDGRLSAQRCRFRVKAGETATTYYPGQARAYGLAKGGSYYRVQAVPAGDSLLAAGTRYFMEVLVDGPAQLYFLRSEQSHERYYVVSPVLPLALLKHAVRTVMREGHRYEEELTPFRQTLAQALTGCAAAQVKLPALAYLESALRRVVQLYNACQGVQPSKRATNANALSVRIGVASGIHRSRFGFAEGVRSTTPTLPTYTGFTGGLTVGLVAPRLSRKISLELGAFYERQRYDVEYTEPYSGGIVYERRSQAHFDITCLQIPLLLRYTYPRGAVQPLVEAGILFRRAFVTDNTYQTTDYRGNVSSPEPLVPDESIQWPEISFGGGLGLTTSALNGRAVGFLVRAETGRSLATTAAFSSTQFSVRALLSINLTK